MREDILAFPTVDLRRPQSAWDHLLRTIPGVSKRQRHYLAQVKRIQESSEKRIHLGCGPHRWLGYINVDRFSSVADVCDDICELGSFADDTIDLIESHHALEHLSFSESEQAIGRWSEKLKLGGYVIVSVPDIDECVRLWSATPESQRWGDGSISRMFFGSQEHPGMFHRSGFTVRRLAQLFETNSLNPKFVLLNYPHRPTPSFLIVAERI